MKNHQFLCQVFTFIKSKKYIEKKFLNNNFNLLIDNVLQNHFMNEKLNDILVSFF